MRVADVRRRVAWEAPCETEFLPVPKPAASSARPSGGVAGPAPRTVRARCGPGAGPWSGPLD